MVRAMWVAAVALVAFGAITLKAAEEKKGGRSSRTIPYTMEQIKERLGTDNALKDDQEKKVQAINDEFTKKMAEANEKPAVKEAQAALDKIREARDFQKMREAYTKLTEAMGFNPYEDYKKALSGVLDEAQVAKLFPARRQRGGGQPKAEQ